MTMYERIRELRLARGMSQNDLAIAVGYKDRSMVTRIENGEVDLAQSKIFAFANVLSISPGELMGILTKDEMNLISFYRGADDRAREDAMDTLVKHQKQDTESERMA